MFLLSFLKKKGAKARLSAMKLVGKRLQVACDTTLCNGKGFRWLQFGLLQQAKGTLVCSGHGGAFRFIRIRFASASKHILRSGTDCAGALFSLGRIVAVACDTFSSQQKGLGNPFSLQSASCDAGTKYQIPESQSLFCTPAVTLLTTCCASAREEGCAEGSLCSRSCSASRE